MKVEHVELLVEEPSAEHFLRKVLPRLLDTDISFEIYPFKSKADLLAKLPERLRGYARWLPETWRLVILVDRDQDDCLLLKQRLESIAKDARLISRSASTGKNFQIAPRIVVEELEAWYFGDWEAVLQAYPRVPKNLHAKARYRDPDSIVNTWETFERILQKAGHFAGGLRKIEAARSIAPHFRPDRCSSKSFRVLHETLAELAHLG